MYQLEKACDKPPLSISAAGKTTEGSNHKVRVRTTRVLRIMCPIGCSSLQLRYRHEDSARTKWAVSCHSSVAYPKFDLTLHLPFKFSSFQFSVRQ